MKYGNVPGVGMPIARLVQGTVMVSMEDLDYAFNLLDAVFEQGCNAFDTAHVYGNGDCERALAAWYTDRGIRDKVVVVTKGAHFNADRHRVTPFDITSDLYDSLARLKTDYIDLYLLHRDDPSVPVEPIVDVLNEHLEAGRIHAFGGSNWTHERLEQANAYARENGLTPFAVSSPHFSLAEQIQEPWPGCVSITGPQAAAARAWYRESEMPVFAWSSLARGFLSGQYTRQYVETFPSDTADMSVRCYRSRDNLARLDRTFELAKEKGLSVAQVAVAYVLNQPLNLFALTACRTADEIRANAEAVDVNLSEEELAWLNLEQAGRG